MRSRRPERCALFVAATDVEGDRPGFTRNSASNTRQSGLASENGKIRTFSSKHQNCALICTAICRMVSSEDKTMPAAISTARLEARISTDLHAMLKRAAELQGRTMTDFVVSAVQDAAQRAIEQAEVIRLSLADQECFAQALLSPPQPAPALERAFARRNKLLRAE
jgi:uncharacterized protein (DUF1778 family)